MSSIISERRRELLSLQPDSFSWIRALESHTEAPDWVT